MEQPSDVKTRTFVDLEQPVLQNKSEVCFMNECVILDSTSEKPLVITYCLATCIAIIIFEPSSKLVMMAHVSDGIDMNETCQTMFNQAQQRCGERISDIRVWLVGGWASHFASQIEAAKAKNFWKAKAVMPNTELLFKRDCFRLDFNAFWQYLLRYMQDFIKEGYLTQQEVDFYFRRHSIERRTFLRRPGMDLDIPKIRNAIWQITSDFCIQNGLMELGYEEQYNLLQVYVGHHPDNPTNRVCYVDYQNPKKSFVSALGFDREKGELFFSEEHCGSLLGAIIKVPIYRSRFKQSQEVASLIIVDPTQALASALPQSAAVPIKMLTEAEQLPEKIKKPEIKPASQMSFLPPPKPPLSPKERVLEKLKEVTGRNDWVYFKNKDFYFLSDKNEKILASIKVNLEEMGLQVKSNKTRLEIFYKHAQLLLELPSEKASVKSSINPQKK